MKRRPSETLKDLSDTTETFLQKYEKALREASGEGGESLEVDPALLHLEMALEGLMRWQTRVIRDLLAGRTLEKAVVFEEDEVGRFIKEFKPFDETSRELWKRIRDRYADLHLRARELSEAVQRGENIEEIYRRAREEFLPFSEALFEDLVLLSNYMEKRSRK
ncbi:hypothetical protein FVE67_05245 [Thermosulfurimonas marina]|uniref:Uncharacterized protein n=1 Tax=Thermosulfurimonas marina TaxID=2047767 RepID=A0A6H1WSR7_9BACT|nr:hypothetical protein [Thermosulfurimonas marina]QJA06243.1 hypothetical protein FVE67_05245 [Thermosulfurimonas marina]